MLLVSCPPGHDAARRWVFEQVFGRFLGLAHSVTPRAGLDHVEIVLPNGRCVRVRERFFAQPEDQWLQPATLPALPLAWADFAGDPVAGALTAARLPVVYGQPCASGAWIDRGPDHAELGLDVFGTAFVLLSRYEEPACDERDDHQRFPVDASIAGRAGFVERPLVDEYAELLWTLIDACAGGSVSRRHTGFSVRIEHDVDAPFKYLFCNVPRLLRTEASAILRRSEVASPLRNLRLWRRVREGNLAADPYNTFGFIMDQSEARGWVSTFYFIADRPAGWRDGLYELDDPAIAALIAEILGRRHRVGLHGSYRSSTSDAQLGKEKCRLEAACAGPQPGWAVEQARQHYLRFEAGATPVVWARVGVPLDLTLSFAQQAGFRCGTSRRFELFGLRQRAPLGVDEQPLIAMDTSLVAYQGLDAAGARDKVELLARRVARYGGCFVLLWHNSMLTSPARRDLYVRLLDTLRDVESQASAGRLTMQTPSR